MIDPDHKRLSIRRQCELVSISRASFYRQPAGETLENLELMRIIDEAFLRLANAVEVMKISNDIQLRMLRAIVTHLDLPAREKADILNMGPTD